MTQYKPTLIEHFKYIEEPRLIRKQLHKLDDIFLLPYVPLSVAVMAVMPLKNLPTLNALGLNNIYR
jgi:hypothetical protein